MNALPSNPSTASTYSSMNIATLSQQARMLRVSTPLDAELVAEQMTLREGVSRLFTLTLDCLAASAELDVASLLGKEISVNLLLADGSMRRWHAVVEGVDALGADGGLARYRLHAAPWLAALALRRDSFIYQDRSVQDIVSEIFADYPQAAFAFELSDTLPPLAICTQYRESDLQFVQRILAEAGLSYRFEHQQDDGQAAGGGARHRVVIFDAGAARPEDPASPLRFHRSDATETRDSITHFSAAQAVRPNAVARAAWNERTLTAHAAQSRSPVQVEALPVLEDYDYAGHGRYADDDAAEQSAARSLRAHESRIVRFAGAGTARSLAPGRLFAMTQHERYADGGSGGGKGDGKQAIDELGGNRYVVLEVVHEASNNLGAQATQVLNTADMERGTYRNRFTAQPEAAALIPAWRPRPTAPESLAAVVVSASDAPITSDRDLRVKVQFPWQRGDKPLTGGLPHRTHGDASGNAPGDERSGTWLRVASAQAGPNWGAHHLPRGGTEVIVEFIDGDIDRPVVSGQLYNDADLPPWSAGENAETNHAGVLSGWHSQGLDGAGRNQWVFDDTRGKLRTRLASSTAATQLGLGHLVEQDLDDANRGAWRGTGFELRSDAWTVVRSGQGMLVSATAREQAKSTQADAQEALLLLRGAQDASRRLNDSAGQHQARPMAAAEGYDELLAALDPEQDGRYTAQVNGQAAGKAASGQRTDSAAVERINGPHLLIDAPNSLNLATPASAVLHAGEHLHATAQSDAHVAAQQTYSAVSARSASVFAQQGPIRAISAQAPVSLHAHTDILEALAGQDITVTSSAEGIEILGNQRVTLQAAGGSVTLDGADIVFKGPGLFSVKGATHNFVGPGSDAANLPALPSTTVDDPLIVSAELVHKDGAMASAAKKAASGLMAGFGGAAGAAGVGTAGLGDIMPSGLAELGQTAAGAASKLSQLAGQANTLAGLAKNPMGALSAAPGLLGNTSPAMGGLLNTAKNTMGMVSQAQALAANPMSALPTASKLLGSVAPGASGMIDSAASAAGKVSQAAALIKDPSAALPAATNMLASVAPEGASKMISGAATFAGMGSGAGSEVGTDAGASAVAGGAASQASAAEATSVASSAPATADAPNAATGGTVQAPQAPAASSPSTASAASAAPSTSTASATSAAPVAADPAVSSPSVASEPSVASTSPSASPPVANAGPDVASSPSGITTPASDAAQASPTATASAAGTATGAATVNAATGEHAAGAAAVDTPPADSLGASPVTMAGSASAPSVAGAGASSIAPSIATAGASSVAPSIATAGASSSAPTIVAAGATGSASSLAASAVPTGASFDAPSMGSASDSFVAPTGQTAVSPSSLPSSAVFTASTEGAPVPDLAASAAPTQSAPAIGGVMAATATPQTIVATDLGTPTVGTNQIATSIPADASINALPAGSLSGSGASTVATALASASDTTLDVANASTTSNAAGTQWSMQDAAGTPDALASVQDNPTPTMTDATSTLATADHTPIAAAATLASASGNGNGSGSGNGLLAAAVATAGAATSLRAHADDQGQARSTGASDASGTSATSEVSAASSALANTPGSTHSSASAATSASDCSSPSASSTASVSPTGSVDSVASDAPAAVATAATAAATTATAATAAAFHATASPELTTRAPSEPRPADARIAAGSAALHVTSDTASAQANGSAARSEHAASPTTAATTPSSSSFTGPGTPVVQDAASVDAHADAREAQSESALPSTTVLASLAASAGALFASAANAASNATSNAANAASSATAAGGAISGAVDMTNVDRQAAVTGQGINLPDATSGAAASSAASMPHDEKLAQLTGTNHGTNVATITSADGSAGMSAGMSADVPGGVSTDMSADISANVSADAASVATPDTGALIASSNTMPTAGGLSGDTPPLTPGVSTQTPGFVSNTQSPLPQGAGLPGGSGEGGLNLPGTQASAGASTASGVAGVGAGAGSGATSAGLGASGSSAAGSATATTTAETSAATGSTNSVASPSAAQTGADTSAAASAPANAGPASVAGDASVAAGSGSESASVASAGTSANTPAAPAGASSTNAVNGTTPDASADTAGNAAHAPANAPGDATGNAAGNASASTSATTSANAPTSASNDAPTNASASASASPSANPSANASGNGAANAPATSPATASASSASTNGASPSATPTSPVNGTPVSKAPAAPPPASAGTAITAAPATPDANLGSATARAAGMSDSTPATRATDLSAVGGAGASAASTTASGSGASGIAAVAAGGGLATFAQQASAASTALSGASTFAAGGVSANVSAAIVPVMTQALNASGDRMAALSSAVDTLFTLPDVKQANIPSVAGAILSMPGLSSSSVPSVIGAILQSPTLATETLPKVAEVLMKIPGVADSPLPQIARDVLDSVGLGPVARTQGTNLPGGTPPAGGSGRVVPGVSTYRARQDGARLQYVNLDQVAERWNDGNALTTTERQSNRPRIHVEFNRPGQHRFTITVKADPANIPYSARERGRRASYQEPHSNPRSYVTNADGTRIVDDIALPAAGLNLYLFEVRDERGQLIKTERVETVRRLYIQEVMCMSARPAHHLADVTPVTAEFALHGIDMIQLPRLQFRGRSAVDAADTPESQQAIMNAVRGVYASSAGKQREPYTLVVCHVDRLAAPGVSGDMRLPVPAGPGGRVMTVPIVNDDRSQSSLWYEFDASDDWLVHARYIHTDASGAERSIPIPRHLITPIRESNGSVWSVSVDLTRLSPTPLTGILNIQFNTVAASYAGLAITGTNLLFVSTLDPYEPNSQAYLTETLAHEMGHLLGMVPSGPDWPGLRTQDDSADDSKLDPPPHFYYNAGGHCYYGLPDQNGEYNEEIGQCVMYGITCANIHFCPSCSKAVRKVDCSEGWTAF